MKFEDYVEIHILSPLQMNQTTFRQPVPSSLTSQLAAGYRFDGKQFQEKPFEVFQIAPAGGASATANDMAKFMLMHLSKGTYNGSRVLKETTVIEMQSRQFFNDPRLTGIACGFYETRINNRVLLTHAGETSTFRSQIFLYPLENLGLYIVYNAPGLGHPQQELAQAFFDRFYPAESKYTIETSPVQSGESARFSGRYISTRSNLTTIEKLRWLVDPFVQPISVKVMSDGYLEVFHPYEKSINPEGYKSSRWEALQPNVFQKLDGTDILIFHTAPSGNVRMFMDSNPLRGFRKLVWYEELFIQPFFPLFLLGLLLVSTVWSFVDKKGNQNPRWMTISLGVCGLLIALGLTAFAIFGFSDYLFGKIPFIWYIVFTLPLILPALSVISLFSIKNQTGMRKILFSLNIVTALTLSGWLHYWNLIGWRF
jgi:hypothetical protein